MPPDGSASADHHGGKNLVQHGRRFGRQCVRRGCARAGMVRYQPPAFRCTVVHIGGKQVGGMHSVGQHDLHTLRHVMYGTRYGLDTVNLGNGDPERSLGEHRVKGRTDSGRANQAPTTGMNAHDVVLLCPAGHEQVDIAPLQGFIKQGFRFVR